MNKDARTASLSLRIARLDYFSQNVTTGATTFTANANSSARYFPRVILPIATIISDLVAFALRFLQFLAFFIYYKFFTATGASLHMNWHVIFLPLILLEASDSAFE